jgi:hypothetical protein
MSNYQLRECTTINTRCVIIIEEDLDEGTWRANMRDGVPGGFGSTRNEALTQLAEQLRMLAEPIDLVRKGKA